MQPWNAASNTNACARCLNGIDKLLLIRQIAKAQFEVAHLWFNLIFRYLGLVATERDGGDSNNGERTSSRWTGKAVAEKLRGGGEPQALKQRTLNARRLKRLHEAPRTRTGDQ